MILALLLVVLQVNCALGLTGVLKSKHVRIIKATKSGKVKSLNFSLGHYLNANQVIGVIDNKNSGAKRSLAKTNKESFYKLKDLTYKHTQVTTPFEGMLTKNFI